MMLNQGSIDLVNSEADHHHLQGKLPFTILMSGLTCITVGHLPEEKQQRLGTKAKLGEM
jgi:hypothetical protein